VPDLGTHRTWFVEIEIGYHEWRILNGRNVGVIVENRLSHSVETMWDTSGTARSCNEKNVPDSWGFETAGSSSSGAKSR
jgi:hypothetical protein